MLHCDWCMLNGKMTKYLGGKQTSEHVYFDYWTGLKWTVGWTCLVNETIVVVDWTLKHYNYPCSALSVITFFFSNGTPWSHYYDNYSHCYFDPRRYSNSDQTSTFRYLKCSYSITIQLTHPDTQYPQWWWIGRWHYYNSEMGCTVRVFTPTWWWVLVYLYSGLWYLT